MSYISQDEKYLPITNATQNPSNELVSLWVAITVIDMILYKDVMGGKRGRGGGGVATDSSCNVSPVWLYNAPKETER